MERIRLLVLGIIWVVLSASNVFAADYNKDSSTPTSSIAEIIASGRGNEPDTGKNSKMDVDKNGKKEESKGSGVEKASSSAVADKPILKTNFTDEEVRNAIKYYIDKNSIATQTFNIEDSKLGSIRRLSFVQLHEKVKRTNDVYTACADLKDTQSDEMLDLDFDVKSLAGALKVVDVRIHRIMAAPSVKQGDSMEDMSSKKESKNITTNATSSVISNDEQKE